MVRYDEARVVLSVTPKGRFKTLVSFAGLAPIESAFVPPEGVDGEALFEEWFESFAQPPTPKAAQALKQRRRSAGEKLFEALFASAAPRILEHLKVLEDRFKSENGAAARGLRIRLMLGDAWGKGRANAEAILPISNLPYELMVPPGLPRFLARRPYVSIVRTIGVAEFVGPAAVSGKLRVLVANAQPRDSVPLGWAAEVRKIQNALKARTDAVVKVLENASFEKTCRLLRDGGFHALHFIGHGGFDANSGQWYLLFETEGARQPVLAETIAEQLGDMPRLRLAVLNACHSGELTREAGGNPLAGIAAALSIHGLPAVVGMQVTVTDGAATEFSNAFYSALCHSKSIEAAIADGRSAINISSPEWATPVFYLRGETSELFEFEASGGRAAEDRDGQVPQKVGYCFVVQPFDGGVFQKRYEDVFAPAIESASLNVYRVDADPSVTVVIDEIEKRIRAADVCLAEISTDNPNVWFELGYALACQKEVVLICDRSLRSRFPFDIQHRSIITYDTHSIRDFEDLKAKITKKLQAALAKEKKIEAAAGIPISTQVGGLVQHEVVALVAVAQNQEILEAGAPAHLVRKDMEKAGFTKIAGMLGLKSIVSRGLVQVHEAYTASEETYSLYSLTNEGYSWLLANQGGLALREDQPLDKARL